MRTFLAILALGAAPALAAPLVGGTTMKRPVPVEQTDDASDAEVPKMRDPPLFPRKVDTTDDTADEVEDDVEVADKPRGPRGEHGKRPEWAGKGPPPWAGTGEGRHGKGKGKGCDGDHDGPRGKGKRPDDRPEKGERPDRAKKTRR